MTQDDDQRPNNFNWDSIKTELRKKWDEDQRRTTAERELLRIRAEQYATPLADDTALTEARDTVLVFKLGQERYGIDVKTVQGVRPLDKLTPLPGVPRFYRGLVNLRGQIITVLDLRRFLGVQHNLEEDDAKELIIVKSANTLELALLAHRVEDVADVLHSSIEPLDDMRYTRGMVTTPQKVILLDMPRLLTDERLIVGGRND